MNLSRRTMPVLGLAAIAGTLATPAAAAEANTSTWERIRRTKTLRLGVTPSEPWYAKDLATGSWIGFGVSLAEAMAKDMEGNKVAFVETTWANAPAGLQAGQFDVMFVLDPTPARALAIDFPFAPVLYYALGYMAKEQPADTSWAALDQPGMTIAVPIGTAMDRWITAHLHKASIIRLPTIDQTILYYESGKARVLVLYDPALVAYRLKVGAGVVIVPKPAVTAVAGAGIRREADKTWRDYLTTVLTYYYENGTTEQLYRDYLARRGLNAGRIPGITKEGLERG